MCSMCEYFRETIIIEHPYQYFDLVDQIRTVLQEGTMFLLEGNCILEEIIVDKPFPKDVLYHVFQCATCGCKFSLSVETYHGSGGSWKVINN